MTGRSSSPAISAIGVRKAFGRNVVLDSVDLTVAEGSVFALLGPNGAGKTTMVNIFATLLEPDDGEIWVAGRDLTADPGGVRRAIGVTGQFSAVDNLLTGEENLTLIADLRHLGGGSGRRRVGELLERFELSDAAPTGLHLFRRDETPARPGDDPAWRPEIDLLGRAHHRTGSPQPPHHVGHHRASSSRAGSRSS